VVTWRFSRIQTFTSSGQVAEIAAPQRLGRSRPLKVARAGLGIEAGGEAAFFGRLRQQVIDIGLHVRTCVAAGHADECREAGEDWRRWDERQRALALLNQQRAAVDLVVIVSDNES
jgi:hypothetical protein